MREIEKSELHPLQAEEPSAEPTDWDEYRQQRAENQTICNQIAERYPLAHQFLAAAGIEVLEYITWDEITKIDRGLQPMTCSTWEERQARDPYDVSFVQKNFPRLAEALDAIPQLDIEDLALNALTRAAFSKSAQNPDYVVNNVWRWREIKRRLDLEHSSDVDQRPGCGDKKEPLQEPLVNLG